MSVKQNEVRNRVLVGTHIAEQLRCVSYHHMLFDHRTAPHDLALLTIGQHPLTAESHWQPVDKGVHVSIGRIYGSGDTTTLRGQKHVALFYQPGSTGPQYLALVASDNDDDETIEIIEMGGGFEGLASRILNRKFDLIESLEGYVVDTKNPWVEEVLSALNKYDHRIAKPISGYDAPTDQIPSLKVEMIEGVFMDSGVVSKSLEYFLETGFKRETANRELPLRFAITNYVIGEEARKVVDNVLNGRYKKIANLNTISELITLMNLINEYADTNTGADVLLNWHQRLEAIKTELE